MRPVAALMACLAASLALLPLAASAVAGPSTEERRLSFKVFLDDREIGYHDFRVRPTARGAHLDSEARFDVKVLFINAFRYRHESHEEWNGDCLVEIRARTRTNDERNQVAGRDIGGRFALHKVSAEGGESLDAGRLDPVSAPASTLDADCVSTFAYWDRGFLDRDRLLNPQTGELVPVDVSRLGSERITVAGVETLVERYRIGTPDGEIVVCYSRAGDHWEWVALESPIEGRTLRYVREDDPALPQLLSSAAIETPDPARGGSR